MNIKQLAKTLNLSTSTVSRALNGYTDVNPDTRLRVQQAAQSWVTDLMQAHVAW